MPRSSPRLIPINRPLPHARAVLRCVCCIHAAVVLNGVLLDVLPHLLDGSVERLVCLFLRRDEVVGVVGGLLGCAAQEKTHKLEAERERTRGWESRLFIVVVGVGLEVGDEEFESD
jgi:hypothetical protein